MNLGTTALYRTACSACERVLKKYVRGFHVCGCRPHCDAESVPTELSKDAGETEAIREAGYRSPRIRRYVLLLDVPLERFIRDVTARVLGSITLAVGAFRSKRPLFLHLKEIVGAIFGKYLFYSPSCNRDEYICQVGVCTEFDPWERAKGGITGVQPRAPERIAD